MTALKSEVVKLREDMILERAMQLLESGWCQRSYAEREDGEETWPTEDDAMMYCATGAVIRAMHDLDIGVAYEDCFDFSGAYYLNVLQRLQEQIPLPYQARMTLINDTLNEHAAVMCWNDSYAQSSEDVILVFKRALHGT